MDNLLMYISDHISPIKILQSFLICYGIKDKLLSLKFKDFHIMTQIYWSLTPAYKFLIYFDSNNSHHHFSSSFLCSKLALPSEISSYFIQVTESCLSIKSISSAFCIMNMFLILLISFLSLS